MPGRSSGCRACSDLDATARVHALLGALDDADADGHTTNLVTADADGAVCVLTSSLGLGTGDFLPGLDAQLNSMLGEVDLVRAPLRPGERMGSMMAPTLVFAGTASSWRSAQPAAPGSARRWSASRRGSSTRDSIQSAAVERPRFHRAGDVVNSEPGVDERALDELTRSGLLVRRWPAAHHYFGGVSLIGTKGAAGDPRRSGHAATLR